MTTKKKETKKTRSKFPCTIYTHKIFFIVFFTIVRNKYKSSSSKKLELLMGTCVTTAETSNSDLCTKDS